MLPAPGMLVDGRYRLVRQLGSGGMGTVWAGEHVLTGRPVALKFVRSDARVPRDAASRLHREARAGALLSHPHVVDVLDLFELEGQGPVMVMSLLEGETLGRRLQRRGLLAVVETASLLLPVVSALGAAHEKGIVHRDLKPENIFVVHASEGVTVKVLDFGIAKLQRESDARLTESGTVLGTPAYMSPEQATGDPSVDCRTDVWALGVILHECLAGRRPIEGRSLGEHVKLLFTCGVSPIQSVKPDVPRDLAALVDSMLERGRETRLADLRRAKEVLARYTEVVVPGFGPPSQRVLAGEPPTSGTQPLPSPFGSAHPTVRSVSDAARTESVQPSAVPRPQSGIYSPSLGAGPKVKGVAFRSSLDAFKRLRGPLAVEAALARAPAELSHAVECGLLLHSGWYPIEWYAGMFAAMRAATGEGRELLTEIGAMSVEIDFRGVYRALLRLVSPERLFPRSAGIFSRYFSAGRFEVLESRAGFARGCWLECRGFDGNMWAEVMGSSRRMLELAGAKGVVTEAVAGGGDGDDFLEVRGTWASQRFGGHDPPVFGGRG